MTLISPSLVIAGSVRPRRLGIHIANWVAAIGRQTIDESFEVVDLKDWPLPMNDEAGMPQGGAYEFEHTRAWSQKIAAAPAFVFVSPQYNGGYPAALKNAIDHIYKEWAGKPAMIVTYGGHGGSDCASQLQQVLKFVKTTPLATKPALRLSRALIEANAGEIDCALEFAQQLSEVQQAFVELSTARKANAA